MKYIVVMSGNIKYVFDGIEAHSEAEAKEKAYKELEDEKGDMEIIDVEVF